MARIVRPVRRPPRVDYCARVADAADDPRSDRELIAAAQQGDVAAFAVLYRRYRDWVARLAHRVAGTTDDALDVLQETFLYVLRKLPELDLRARFTTFLWPVVRNLARQARRRRAAVADAATAGAPAVEDPPPQAHDDLVAALGALPQGQRDVVLLRFVDGLALAEIAAALAIPPGTVKSRLHAALAALRADPAARRWFLG
jgi:RNA polymerase sigma-70 factor (ECF subfamily)